MLSRATGPVGFGQFQFLSDFFTRIAVFAEMGAGQALLTFLSRRPKDSRLIKIYLLWMLVAAVAVVLFVGGVFFSGLDGTVWPDQIPSYIWIALLFCLFKWLTEAVQKIFDALGFTFYSEAFFLFQKTLVFLAIAIAYLYADLSVPLFFAAGIGGFLLYILTGFLFLKQNHQFETSENSTQEVRAEYLNYCKPLITYSLVGLMTGATERWLLQYFRGNVEQGYFGLSLQVSQVVFLFSGAMIPIFSREYSIASSEKNYDKMKSLFFRISAALYGVACYFSCFVLAHSDQVSVVLGGKDFVDGKNTLAAAALLPIHQTLGQLVGSVFLASGQTKLYRTIGICSMGLGLVLSYLVLAPSSLGGLAGGSSELMWRTVVLQVMTTNIFAYFICKQLQSSFFRLLSQQVLTLSIFVFLAYTLRWLTNSALPHIETLPSLLLSGVVYAFVGLALIRLTPAIFGITKAELQTILAWRKIGP
jgi:O-antigen/teichoic acid export membrane protein